MKFFIQNLLFIAAFWSSMVASEDASVKYDYAKFVDYYEKHQNEPLSDDFCVLISVVPDPAFVIDSMPKPLADRIEGIRLDSKRDEGINVYALLRLIKKSSNLRFVDFGASVINGEIIQAAIASGNLVCLDLGHAKIETGSAFVCPATKVNGLILGPNNANKETLSNYFSGISVRKVTVFDSLFNDEMLEETKRLKDLVEIKLIGCRINLSERLMKELLTNPESPNLTIIHGQTK